MDDYHRGSGEDIHGLPCSNMIDHVYNTVHDSGKHRHVIT